jgi:hypothetical protein
MKSFALALVALFVLCSGAQAQGYSTPAEQRYSPYSANLPPCVDPGVLSTITGQFGHKEAAYWNSTLQIGSYDRVQQIGFRANGLGYIPRRYCVARAQLNDQKPRAVIYAIQEDLGLLGWGYGVEWCVVGLDRNLAYAPGCQAVRPFLDRNLDQKVLRELY